MSQSLVDRPRGPPSERYKDLQTSSLHLVGDCERSAGVERRRANQTRIQLSVRSTLTNPTLKSLLRRCCHLVSTSTLSLRIFTKLSIPSSWRSKPCTRNCVKDPGKYFAHPPLLCRWCAARKSGSCISQTWRLTNLSGSPTHASCSWGIWCVWLFVC